MKTRQHNIPSEYEESEEAERLASESSDDSEYAPASIENTSEEDDQTHEDSPSSSRGTGATDKISTSVIPRPSNALSDNPIQVVFHLNPPKHALSEVFSPQQLSQLGLQSLAQVDLLSNMVTPGKLGAMLLTFPKLNNKILYVEHLGRAMGIKNMPIPLPVSKTYSRLTPRETADACDELLCASHPDFQRHQKIFHILHYYFLMRFPVVNSLSLPSPRLYDMFFCLCHSLPYPFQVTMFKAIQNRTKRFKTQRKGKAEKFHCYAAPIMQWMAQLISESDTPGSSQPPATDKGKRSLPGRGVQTRGGHSKRTKVSRDSAADLSSLPFSQSHHTRSLRTQTSSLISPTPITAIAGRTMVSSAPQTTPQMTSPIGTVGPAPSTIVHQTGLTAATTISMEPSTSTPTPRTSVPQGITHFMSRADKLLQMERSATLTIADVINTIHGAQKMHAVTYERMYEELLDTHQRVYDRDVEKAALFDRNRILNRQLKQVNAGSSTKWKILKNRRLQNWGGVVHEKGLLPQQLPLWLSELTGNICKDVGLFPSPLNHVLINEYLPGQGIMPHQDGPAYFPVVAILSLGSPAVMQFTPHQKLLDPSEAIGDIHEPVSVLLMPGSLLVFKDAAYQDYLHGISESVEHSLDKTTVNLDRVQMQNGELFSSRLLRDTQNDPVIMDEINCIDNLGCDKKGSQKDVFQVVKRNGTRISLTCRLVPKVHKNLFKF
ncbi:hypothetical protein L7F22_031999 [Adiantum nelumboides]|nr:hypothetical protein [Adiantum nelumboides]